MTQLISNLTKQRGLALVMAVLIAALATSAIAFAAWRQQVRVRDAEIRADSAQTQQVVRSSITLARTLLIDDINNNSTYDYLGDDWAKPITDVNVEQGKVSGRLTEMQGRFNLNTLVDGSGQAIPIKVENYRRLLATLNLAPNLADTLLDWLDADDILQVGGAEDLAYLAKDPPYRAANRPLSDLSELLLIEGYTPQIIATLKPFVTVYPQDTLALINVNTTTPEVLAACIPNFSTQQAKLLLTDVDKTPFKNIADFQAKLALALPSEPNLSSIVSANFGVSSQYFLADLKVAYGKVTWREQVFLWRNVDRNPGLRTRTLWRRRLPLDSAE